jgi:hypothetical protein
MSTTPALRPLRQTTRLLRPGRTSLNSPRLPLLWGERVGTRLPALAGEHLPRFLERIVLH